MSYECWKQVWIDGYTSPGCNIPYQNCGKTYNINIFDANGNFNISAQTQAIQDYIKIYDNYITGSLTNVKHNITIPGLPGYDILQEAILDACNKLPGTCIPASNKYVVLGSQIQNNNIGYTRLDLSNNQGLLNFYGCVSPALTEPISAANNLTNDKQCDPLCNRINTIKLYDDNANLLECNKSVCIIDQITINAVDTSTGNINFNQVCNNCGDIGCICIISGVDINKLWSNIPNANFSQDCGAKSLCYQTDDNNNLVPVNCNDTIVNNNTSEVNYKYLYILIGILVFIFIIFIYLYIKNS